MNNYKLKIQYDGTNYAGWQIQKNVPTVQQRLIESAETILREEINLIGSGRTDAGVHAFGQVANFQLEQKIDIRKFQHSMNSLLPPDIAIVTIEEVPERFHARFDAKKRSYIYLISKTKSPFYWNYSYYFSNIHKYDFNLLNQFSGYLIGTHDFTSFAKTKTETENKVCTINNIHWRNGREITHVIIEADRFLHGMVRTIIGTIIHAVKNDYDYSYLQKILECRNREAAGESVPAKGLFLFKVKY